MLGLLGPRLIAGSTRRNRQLELDAATFSSSFQILIKKLEGGRMATRAEMMAALEAGGISTAGQRGYHILAHAALEGLICFGPRQAKQQTFVLAGRMGAARPGVWNETKPWLSWPGDIFASHGPASLADFTWWSGLPAAEARASAWKWLSWNSSRRPSTVRSIGCARIHPMSPAVTPTVHLLPAFDEYFLGYTDRSAILDPRFDRQLVSSNGVFRPMLVIDGQVVGTWKQELAKGFCQYYIAAFPTIEQV